MTYHRALCAFLLIAFLAVGRVSADDAPAKAEEPTAEQSASEKQDEKQEKKKKDKDAKKQNGKKKKDKKDKKAKAEKKKSKKKEGEKRKKKDDSKKDDSKKDDSKKDDSKKDDSKKDDSKKDDSKKDDSKKDDSKKDDSKKDDSKKDEPKKDEPKKDEPKKDEPKKDEPKKDEPKKDEPTPAKMPEPQPEAMKPEAKPEEKPAPKSEEKPQEKPQPKPEAEAKPDPKPEPKPQPKPKPKPDPRKIAMLDLDEVDADFALQGEYYGQVRLPGGTLETVGLQVVARGNGKFIGRQLRGGLPGNGWFNGDKLELEGEREGRRALLFHGDYRISVEDYRATIVNSNGDTLGILRRVDRKSNMLGLKPTPGAVVLFDGTSTDKFVGASMDEHGNLKMGTVTKDPVRDFRLHLEFRLPYMPYATGQGRSNSGLYIQERYEVQILDSFGLTPQFNDCASLYRTKIPDLNMCFPPLAWQTYDVYFTAARFDAEGKKISPALISVLHNGILVQDNFKIPNKTGAGKKEGPTPGVIKLQDHSNPVVFRNIWIEYRGEPIPTPETLPTPAK